MVHEVLRVKSADRTPENPISPAETCHPIVDTGPLGCGAARHINGCEGLAGQDKSVPNSGHVRVATGDYRPRVVDPYRGSIAGIGSIDGGEAAPIQQKAVTSPTEVNVGTHDLPGIVYAGRNRE